MRRDRDGSRELAGRDAEARGLRGSAHRPNRASRSKLSVPEVKISDGQVHVRDLVPEKGFKADLSGIQATLRGFAMPQAEPAQAELALRTSLGEQVKYAGSLTLSPLASEGAIEANRIRLVELPALLPGLHPLQARRWHRRPDYAL